MTLRHKIAVVIAGAVLVAGGLAACGNAADQGEGPTVADVQQQALAAQERARAAEQDPAKRYPPLPRAAGKNLYNDGERPDGPHWTGPADLRPIAPTNELQVGQDPVATALQRIQEIAAKSADISNRAEEARNYFNSVDPLYDAVKDKLDGKTRDGLEKGFKDMRNALDRSASAPPVEVDDLKAKVAAMEDAETASGDIQVVIYHFLQDNFKPNNHSDQVDKRGVYCSPVSGCDPQDWNEE